MGEKERTVEANENEIFPQRQVDETRQKDLVGWIHGQALIVLINQCVHDFQIDVSSPASSFARVSFQPTIGVVGAITPSWRVAYLHSPRLCSLSQVWRLLFSTERIPTMWMVRMAHLS